MTNDEREELKKYYEEGRKALLEEAAHRKAHRAWEAAQAEEEEEEEGEGEGMWDLEP